MKSEKPPSPSKTLEEAKSAAVRAVHTTTSANTVLLYHILRRL